MTQTDPAIAPPRIHRAHLEAAGLAAVVTAALAGIPAAAGWSGLVVALAAVQALMVLAWMTGLALPGRIGTLVLGLAAAAGADIAAAVYAPPSLAALLSVLALAFLAMLVHQLCRGVVRVRATASIAGVATLVTLTVGSASLLVLHRIPAGADLASAAVLAVGSAVCVGHLVDVVLPLPRFSDQVPRGALATLVGAAVAAVAAAWRLDGVGQVTRAGAVFVGIVLGLVAGLVAVGVSYIEKSATPRPAPLWWLALPYLKIALPLAATAPVAYVVGRIVVG
ncbi:MAG TPA: hypothetical protein VGH85_12335 [Mycobacteriales bacterium]